MTTEPDPTISPEDDDMSDREFLQADDEMPGEEFADVLARLGMTEDKYYEIYGMN